MDKKYLNLYELMKDNSQAKEYFESLPEYVRSAILQRPGGVNSFDSLCSYADNLTQGDR